MTSRTLASIGLAGAIASVALLGATTIETRAVAGRVGSGADARGAEKAAEQAQRALKRDRAAEAIRYAETAVELMPGEAAYRGLLGRAYLGAGRFESARAALVDALSLDDANGTVALNLALAQIATGDWAGARATLDGHQATIPARDRGLAMALAGDPEAAVEMLQVAARSADADATTRQNLALALALSGRWAEAKVVAAVDVAPGELNDRLMQWMTFAQPRGAADQVAALLGVTPVLDSGQPTGLALAAKPGVESADAGLDAFMPGTPGETETVAQAEAPAPAAEPEDVMVAAATVAPAPAESAAPADEVVQAALAAPAASGPRVTFAPRREVVQAIPMAPLRPATAVAARTGKVPTMLASGEATRDVRVRHRPGTAPAAPVAGKWFVQLGAFDNASVAQERWSTLSRKVGALSAHQPQGARATVNGASYYRLSVGGFARADAVGMCAEVRRVGGRCFVRQEAGDRLASWVKPGRPMQQRIQTAAMKVRVKAARPVMLASR